MCEVALELSESWKISRRKNLGSQTWVTKIPPFTPGKMSKVHVGAKGWTREREGIKLGAPKWQIQQQ